MISKRMGSAISAAVLGVALAATLTAAASADEAPRSGGRPTSGVTTCESPARIVEKDGKLLLDDGKEVRELKADDRVRAVPAIPAVPPGSAVPEGTGVPHTESVPSTEKAPPAEDAPEGEKGLSEDADQGVKGTTERGTPAEGAHGRVTAVCTAEAPAPSK
ncbi:hypothetical protein [Sphaerisporangium perillae]|uniref:hypothetical protein n=1 Tax=Sphaerisporangium perillae TaxID=2935860 RepID=UPI00200CA59C|nr:hypothetical protein [Sphaerisporangium perillae]